MEAFKDWLEFALMVMAIAVILYISLIAFIKVLIVFYIGETKRRSLRALKMILVRLFK